MSNPIIINNADVTQLEGVLEGTACGVDTTAVLPDNGELSLGPLPWLPAVGTGFYIHHAGQAAPAAYAVVRYDPVWLEEPEGEAVQYTVRMVLQHAE